MPSLLTSAQLTLVDLNDAIISGTAPASPVVGTLWLDDSVPASPRLKKWNGTSWVDQPIDLKYLDPNADGKIEDHEITLANISDDNKLSRADRIYLKDKITAITGIVPADTLTSLPTLTSLDSGLVGEVYSLRKQALNAGLLSSDASYAALGTEYDNLRVYLGSLTPKPWDVGTTNAKVATNVVSSIFRDKWLKYYTAADKLAEAIAAKLKKNVEESTKEAEDADTQLRQDLRLTAALPTSIKQDANGITAYTSDPNKYARMDYRGLYIAGGAIQISGGLPDSQIASAGAWNKQGTYIDATGVYTGIVEANQISVAGGKLTDAQIGSAAQWNNQGTYIDQNGIYTGNITWNQGAGGTLALGGLDNANGELTVLDDEGSAKIRLSNSDAGFGEISADYLRDARNVILKTDEGDRLFDSDSGYYKVYVDGDQGSDTTGDGTRDNPYESIQHAINNVPRFLDFDCYVNIHPCATPYNENIQIQGFKGEGVMRLRSWLKDVRYIRDWSTGNSKNTGNHWVELRAVDAGGTNRALNKSVSSNGSTSSFARLTDGNTDYNQYGSSDNGTSPAYAQVDLGAVYDLHYFDVMRYYGDARYYKDIKTEVSTNGSTWRTIWDNSKMAGNFYEIGEYKPRSPFINGRIHAYSCDNIEIDRLHVDSRSTGTSPFFFYNCSYASCLRTIGIASSSIDYVYYSNSSYLRLSGTESEGGSTASICSAYGSRVDIFSDNWGGDNPYSILAYSSSIVAGSGTIPYGDTGATKLNNGGIFATNWTSSSFKKGFYSKPVVVDPTPPPPPPPQPKTSTWTSTDSESWRPNFGGQWYGGRDVIQGAWAGYGVYEGYWFFDDKVRAAVAGKSISRIRVYMTRNNSGGISGAVPVYIRAHQYSTRTGAGSAPTYYGTASTAASFKWGESKWVTLNSNFHTYFASNSCRGIMIYFNSTSTSFYARMSGTAKIEITYT